MSVVPGVWQHASRRSSFGHSTGRGGLGARRQFFPYETRSETKFPLRVSATNLVLKDSELLPLLSVFADERLLMNLPLPGNCAL